MIFIDGCTIRYFYRNLKSPTYGWIVGHNRQKSSLRIPTHEQVTTVIRTSFLTTITVAFILERTGKEIPT